MVEGTCANCVFSSGSAVTGLRLCRRNAPQTVEMKPNYALAVNYTQTSTTWPAVHNFDWCGEWRGKVDTPSEDSPLPTVPENPHDHTRFFSNSHHDNKGYSEEKCVLCGWVMGDKPLNCNNDNTPHVFPSQETEFDQLMDSMELAWGLIANAQYWDRSDLNKYDEWEAAKIKWRDEHWHPALNNELKSLKPRKE